MTWHPELAVTCRWTTQVVSRLKRCHTRRLSKDLVHGGIVALRATGYYISVTARRALGFPWVLAVFDDVGTFFDLTFLDAVPR